jgi:hypothetical protein
MVFEKPIGDPGHSLESGEGGGGKERRVSSGMKNSFGAIFMRNQSFKARWQAEKNLNKAARAWEMRP